MICNLAIRRALPGDVKLLYNWSNDILVRSQSFNSDKISFEMHSKWFEGKLKDQQALIYIVEADAIPAVLVRFDISLKRTVIGLVVSKDYRGKGLGAKAIKICLNEYFRTHDLPVLASIKKDNIASIKSFQKAGFVFLKT
tara:strand:+ start:239 stop:658 length:420 start_codon:yes stop_codon:yes gene_type:complete